MKEEGKAVTGKRGTGKLVKVCQDQWQRETLFPKQTLAIPVEMSTAYAIINFAQTRQANVTDDIEYSEKDYETQQLSSALSQQEPVSSQRETEDSLTAVVARLICYTA